jgi:triosephosphate isomerase (TIM)
MPEQREKIIAANWKMHKTLHEGLALLVELNMLISSKPTKHTVVVAPPYIHLQSAVHAVADTGIKVAAQNCHQAPQGAYTGEVSAEMLQSVGAEYVILGHSERRQYFGETDELVAEKIKAATDFGLKVIYCCGESLAEREAGTHFELVKKQITIALEGFAASILKDVVIAYEPVWAIGTGLTASPEQAQEMHAFIRETLQGIFGAEIANTTPILYGGSMKPANAAGLLSQPDVDGGLIGGASLIAKDFFDIIHSLPS